MTRVVLAMSGGVDSSVAAHLLLEEGYDVVGVFMRHGDATQESCSVDEEQSQPGQSQPGRALPVLGQPDGGLAAHKQGCCSASDAADARRVADRLGIPFYALDLQTEFSEIVDYFVDEYVAGRTPNPCVMCNNWIKFGRLFDFADSAGAEFVATGHYARIESVAGRRAILRGVDETKDQSYVLFGIDREYLPRTLLPVGGYRKAAIRGLAKELGLRVADKRDSQEICFVASGRHAEFVARRAARETAGEIVTTDGSVLGEHTGIEGFTIGQRKGLGVAVGEPRYVVRIEPAENRVVVGTRRELACRQLIADRTNWLADPGGSPFRCSAQIRYNSAATAATAHITAAGRLEVVFDEPRDGIAPGQAVVCYDGQQVLGGGWIRSTE